jgi:Fe-S cluster biogenesis protein NfuA
MEQTIKPEIFNKVEEALNTIRPYLEQDGGNVELVDINENNDIVLKLLGNCSSCEMSDMTMTAGIEETLRRTIPGLGKIVAVKA